MTQTDNKESMYSTVKDSFDEKYSEIFHELALLGKSSTEEQAYRIEWLNSKLDYKIFSEDCLCQLKPRGYHKLYVNQKISEKNNNSMSDANNDQYFFYKDFDSVAFMEALEESVKYYTGIPQGTPNSFISLLRNLYKKKYGCMSLGNTHGTVNLRKERAAMHVIKGVKALSDHPMSANDIKETIEKIFSDSPNLKNYLKNSTDIQLIYNLLDNSFISSIDSPPDEDSEMSFYELFPDERTSFDFLRVDNSTLILSIIDKINEFFEKGIWPVDKKGTQNFKRCFTHAILQPLKTDKNGLVYQDFPINDAKITVNIYGNSDIYEILKPKGKKLMEHIFLISYLDYLYRTSPKEFYNVYADLLKPEFKKLENKTMAKSSGRLESSISDDQKDFRKKISALCQSLS